jgi:hypothetical protein
MSKRPTKKYKNQIKTNKTKQADKQTNKETKHKLKLRLIKKQGVNLGTHEGPAVLVSYRTSAESLTYLGAQIILFE